jgi:hypothetical protein
MTELTRKSAEDVNDTVLRCARELDESIRLVLEKCQDSEARLYRSLAGQVMGQLFTDILRPLYRAYPDLEPGELKARAAPESRKPAIPLEVRDQLLELAASLESRLSTLVGQVSAAEGDSVGHGLAGALRGSSQGLNALSEFVRRASQSGEEG